MVTDFKHTNIFKKWLDDIMDHKFIIDINDPLFGDLCSDLLLKENESLSWHENLIAIYNNDYKFARPDLDKLYENFSCTPWSEERKQALVEKYEGLIIVDFVPTSERLCQWWYEVANKMLNGLGIDVVAVEYWETPKSHCRYQPE